ncbi:nSTAND3 domain-containing NTPase [Pareuzebyella sediminis]|uniref:nSTAND3 domain-containing NTPase n=1 Tax=Pareuzebyella sediminis TaxID=2607998 RepID=UPI0011F086A3|nr:hypothetical protein [Pareuzebyella sediminis]
MKYNLDELHWQEFEVLAFKVVQILVSPDTQFIEGGSDKGRDFVYDGRSKDFKNDWAGKWIFQAKHKSKDNNIPTALTSDLKRELDKVFVKNKLEYDNYILVTNKTIDGTLFDLLNNTFHEFISKMDIRCHNFSIIGYRQIESCIDYSNELKWSYPNIISHPNFAVLIREATNYNLETRKRAWLNNIEKHREKFVYTNFFQKAFDKLNIYPAIILSGPPKSGKTFNAEILALNYSVFKGFQPILIDNADEIEKAYEIERKQVFICDDAFGKHSLSYRAEDWFQKLERIFNLADSSHLFLFTSREYIFRAFINFGNEEAKRLLEKIIVESHNYSAQEKLSILHRYTETSNISEFDKTQIRGREKELTSHKNFSPETIRAFFANIDTENNNEQLELLRKHIEKPDAYLSVVFSKLNEIKQAALLAVLCSPKNDESSIITKFATICSDLGMNQILDSRIEIDELEDSMLKVLKTDKIQEISFYHPSMQDFLIGQLIVNDTGKLREIVIKNPNQQILEISLLRPFRNSMFKSDKRKIIELNKHDVPQLGIGIKRLINNYDLTINIAVYIFSWFEHTNHTLDLKINDAPLFESAKGIVTDTFKSIQKKEFYFYHKEDSSLTWANLFLTVKSNSIHYGYNLDEKNIEYLNEILEYKKNDKYYWKLVFRLANYTSEEVLLNTVGKNWLNDFYINLKEDIFELGYELYGKDFPEFKKYKAELLEKKHPQKRKYKPNNSWYPRYLSIHDRISILKEIKGLKIGFKILDPLILPYDEIKQVSDYARNRHRFNVSKGWWSN